MQFFRRIPAKTIWGRLAQLRSGRVAIEQKRVIREHLDKELQFLIEVAAKNLNIKHLSDSEGWREIEQSLITLVAEQLVDLPQLVIDNPEKAQAVAFSIIEKNAFLGMVNEPLLESTKVAMMVEARLKGLGEITESENGNG